MDGLVVVVPVEDMKEVEVEAGKRVGVVEAMKAGVEVLGEAVEDREEARLEDIEVLLM